MIEPPPSNENKSVLLRVEAGISFLGRNQSCQPFAPSSGSMVRVASAQNYRRLSGLGFDSNVEVDQSGASLRIANPPRIV
jgi:hypothetical protein